MGITASLIHQLPRLLLLPIAVLLLSACGETITTGPEEIRWDREVCVRCLMAVSDRHYSAQVRRHANQPNTEVFKFDDIGCAVIWLDEQDWKYEPGTEIWVNEKHTGKWIDARTAHYSIDNITPMAYGLAALEQPEDGTIDFEQAVVHIYKIEETFNVHGGSPHPDPIPETIESKQ